jgi:hypothetical protein
MDVDNFIPHKMHVKLKSNVNTTSRKIDFQSAAIVNSLDSDLLAQNNDDMNIQSIFKADMEEKDEHVTASDQEFKAIYLLVDIAPKVLDEFVGGITVNFIRNDWGSVYLESTSFPDGVYIGNSTLIGFSSITAINTLISAIQEAESKEDMIYIARKLYDAHGYCRQCLTAKEEEALNSDAISSLSHFFQNKKFILELPLDFGRIEQLKKIKIIDGVELYALDLAANNIDRISLLVTENTLTELPPVGPFYFNKKGRYLVDESLELEAQDNSLIAESVYPDIADSLVL